MLFGIHLITGAAIGTVVPSPAPAIGLAVLSHYTIDHLPHWNYLPRYRSRWEDSWKMALEPVVSSLIFFAAAWWFGWSSNILVPAIAAVVPDLLESIQYLLRSRLLGWHSRWHHFGHWHARLAPSLPIALTIIAVAVVLLVGQ
jgi:hypothetical protein